MDESYGMFIKKHRIASGYKRQKHFSEKSGISISSMSRIEKGQQRPNVDLLKVMAPYLTTTSHIELMVACGYWDREMLTEEVQNRIKENRKLINLRVDGQQLTEEEVDAAIAFIRTVRQLNLHPTKKD